MVFAFAKMMLSLFACVVLLLYPVSLGSPTAHAHLNEIKDLIIHEADMDDIDLQGITQYRHSEQRVKRFSPGHARLCPAKVVHFKAKDFFKGRFSDNTVIIPQTFRSTYCLNRTVQSHSSRGQHCLSIMDCQETKTNIYFVVYDPAKVRENGCLRGEIAKINNVAVECSCLWPRYLGKDPETFLNRQH